VDKNHNDLHKPCSCGYHADPEAANADSGVLDAYSDWRGFWRRVKADIITFGQFAATSRSASYFILEPKPN
jgi:hypothetical protein